MAKESVPLVIGLGVLSVIGIMFLRTCNDNTHEHDAYIYFSGDWLPGESKECRQGLPLIHLLCGEVSDNEMSVLFNATTKQWNDARFHSMRVQFLSDPTVNDPNRSFLIWRCERRSSDFKCWRIH
jgi:hypothetical protein